MGLFPRTHRLSNQTSGGVQKFVNRAAFLHEQEKQTTKLLTEGKRAARAGASLALGRVHAWCHASPRSEDGSFPWSLNFDPKARSLHHQ